MIWTVIQDGSALKVETNFADGVYQQERSIIRVTCKTDNVAKLIVDTIPIGSYIKDSNNIVYIDLTDYFSTLAFGDSGQINISTTTFTSGYDIDYFVVALRNPLYMEIPPAFIGSLLISQVISISLPNVWYEPLFGLNDSVEMYRYAEMLPTGWSLIRLKNDSVTYNINPLTIRSYDIPSGDGSAELVFVDRNRIETLIRLYTRKTLLCDRRYAAVEWISRSGVVKRHTWEVRDIKDSAINGIELQSRFNAYREAKGYEKTIVLHLDGLTRYDYWYYSDIITSSDVRVALNEVDSDFGDETRVQVVTKSAEQPNANGLYSLDVEVKYRHYDRI